MGCALSRLPTSLEGAFVFRPDIQRDERGFFARLYAEEDFALSGLNTRWPEWSIAFNSKRGTLRGMHFQLPPHDEAKLIRCTRGAVHDVLVDLRRESATYKKWVSIELTEANRSMLYAPRGMAHGYLTLMDDTELEYYVSAGFDAASARGVRWDDPALGIAWPFPPSVISERDRSFPLFNA